MNTDIVVSQDKEAHSGSQTERNGTDTAVEFYSFPNRLSNAVSLGSGKDIPRPEYSGRPHEDPNAFLVNFEDTLHPEMSLQNAEGYNFTLPCLKNEPQRRI